MSVIKKGSHTIDAKLMLGTNPAVPLTGNVTLDKVITSNMSFITSNSLPPCEVTLPVAADAQQAQRLIIANMGGMEPGYNLKDVGPAGGYIFYINPNYLVDGWHYLEAASPDPSDEFNRVRQWTDFGYRTTPVLPLSGSPYTIGQGQAMTDAIVTQIAPVFTASWTGKPVVGGVDGLQVIIYTIADDVTNFGITLTADGVKAISELISDWNAAHAPTQQLALNGIDQVPDALVGGNPQEFFISQAAATFCNNYAQNGYQDWYLPTMDEMHQMYANLMGTLPHVGGFGGYDYWTSSPFTAATPPYNPVDATVAWAVAFTSGASSPLNKNLGGWSGLACCRPARTVSNAGAGAPFKIMALGTSLSNDLQLNVGESREFVFQTDRWVLVGLETALDTVVITPVTIPSWATFNPAMEYHVTITHNLNTVAPTVTGYSSGDEILFQHVYVVNANQATVEVGGQIGLIPNTDGRFIGTIKVSR